MDHNFWLERWRQSEISFHQAETNAVMQTHWPALGLATGSAVFVPLCGKSLDMVWLAGQGHGVIGIDLSQIAIDAFFAEQGLTPDTRTESGFTITSAGPYELWCGDIFAMPAVATRDITAIYDRAALIALPPDLRARYADRLTGMARSAAADTVKALLITLEYDQSIVPGPPHSVLPAEVHALYDADWAVSDIARDRIKARAPKFAAHGIDTVTEATYVMASGVMPSDRVPPA